MTDYGVQPTGYVRKPLSVILAEIEAKMITEFGPGVVQTSQSPLGQLNGLVADLVAEIDERNLDIYQSYDPDQAEGVRLDTLARIRLIERGVKTDLELRQVITNVSQSRIDILDLKSAVNSIEGVSYAEVFVNETGEITNEVLENGTVAVAVIGGDDSTIAQALRQYIVPGINTYGNYVITSEFDGLCRSYSIIRPFEIDVNLIIEISIRSDRFGCPPPATDSLIELVVTTWNNNRLNGLDPSFYTIRSIIESEFTNVEVISVTGERDGVGFGRNSPVEIGFIEIANLTSENIQVNVV